MLFLGRDKLCADVVFGGEVRWKKTWGELGGAPVKEQLQGSGEAIALQEETDGIILIIIQECIDWNMLSQVADLRDVHALIFKMGDGGSDLPAHLFLIAPKIDFRQISAPNFLADS